MAESTSSRTWREIVAKYQTPSVKRSVWQLVSTLLLLVGATVVMYWSLSVSYWLTLALAVPAAGLWIRTFIIMHDCGHGSFLPSRTWNDIVGWVPGRLTATPCAHWRREHAIHHATSGHLEQRGTGDITTLTVREYLSSSWLGRTWYRIYRNPLILMGIGPTFLFIKHRWPSRGIAGKKGDHQRPRHQPRPRGAVHGAGPPGGVPGADPDLAPDLSPERRGRGAPLLRAAPVRGRLLARRERVGLRHRGGDGKLLFPAAPGAPMVHREHRIPPRAPPEPADPELPAGALPPGEPDLPEGDDPHPRSEPPDPGAQAVGRGERPHGWLRPPPAAPARPAGFGPHARGLSRGLDARRGRSPRGDLPCGAPDPRLDR